MRHTYPPPEGTWDQAYSATPCGQTDTCENITFPQLPLRAVINSTEVWTKTSLAKFLMIHWYKIDIASALLRWVHILPTHDDPWSYRWCYTHQTSLLHKFYEIVILLVSGRRVKVSCWWSVHLRYLRRMISQHLSSKVSSETLPNYWNFGLQEMSRLLPFDPPLHLVFDTL